MSNMMTICALLRGLGLGNLFTLWIPLLKSLKSPLTNFPFCWLSLGSLDLILIPTCTPYVIVGCGFGKIIVFCLVTNIGSTLLDILMP
jgi:hypothetical protein